MESMIVISLFAGFIILLLLMGVSIKPLRFLGLGIVKIMIGALFLFFLNVVGVQLNIHIPINIATAAVSGFLGIPGVAALIAIDQLLL
ncbi:pro-sigmaK processing inhibitor BofA [Pueribacillus theae]|uniref:Pro-sigmaK processing inhibitor BofA n=2 Tax=Pueribacillus theae TaxID=2171751 RepID=A0A2U1K568_9BACI|nr:pro-sigmaK processing inhibitor BofA family protein [Pueribacillus theae]PWA12098.1 pro-sigmaK processing inhibitor BofA [Pueribacillus theae]